MSILDIDLIIARIYRLIDMATKERTRRVYNIMLKLFEDKKKKLTAATVSG